ncbi:hypothetical protein [Ferrovibrio terrae]|uniref:hypothetical protein n=1 Tax=Ferrovibrio terrae TaxID=2594003 RepID=UPI003137EC00
MTTAEVRSYRDHWYDANPWEPHHEYLWSEGNYGCDCNRGLFFARANGDTDKGVTCGESRYRVLIRDADGRVLFSDENFPDAPVAGAG